MYIGVLIFSAMGDIIGGNDMKIKTKFTIRKRTAIILSVIIVFVMIIVLKAVAF